MAESVFIEQTLSKKEKYKTLLPQLESLISDEDDLVANLANVAAVLKSAFNFFWVGFYLFKNNELVLGPFQGPIACTRIQIGRGVCGKTFQAAKTTIVKDVSQFEDHIVCSPETKSEIVVPIISHGTTVGVLDVDSNFLNDFDEQDQDGLEAIAHLLSNKF